MVAIADQIRARLKELKKSARRASIDGGLTPDAIRNVLRKKSLNPRRDTLAGIARGLECRLEDLLEPGSVDGSTRNGPAKGIPLISWSVLSHLTETNSFYSPAQAEELIVTPPNSRNFIALRIQGDSMGKIAPDESIIIVDLSDRLLQSGRYYVFNHYGDTMFKQFHDEPARLEDDNTNSCATIFYSDDIRVIGRVTEVTRKLP